MGYDLVFLLVLPSLIQGMVGLYLSLLFLRKLRLPAVHRSGAATLILPLTGASPGLSALLHSINTQSISCRRLIISVESHEDPAYHQAMALAEGFSFPVEVVIAGYAVRCGQKCWNQVEALERINQSDEVIVLLDADIRPQRWWLSALISPILDGRADIVTGYRWPVLDHSSFGGHVIASIDRAIALLPRLDSAPTAWGGSLAFSREAVERLQLGKLLSTTLSDDLSIAREAIASQLVILTRRALLVPTPVRASLLGAWCFGRRQYQIVRIYLPQLWFFALTMTSVRLLGWAMLFSGWNSPVGQPAFALLICLSLAECLIQNIVARRLGCADSLHDQIGQWLLALFKPLLDLFHWGMVIAAGSNRIRWGHISYQLNSATDVSILKRSSW
ncbi:MAG: hypothetical protein KJ558_06910 [Gammaproteobacteria bacterium]|nr:hypothetical protein [Gammaproteobacteria bacterium]MBU1654548.1 hypothetical protein [Gammaproteobacteria bacterium]MBU1961940.1 hypothetical protein [Gammaproteobacteria bacterium]